MGRFIWLSLAVDSDRQVAIALDERRGVYWLLEGPAYASLMAAESGQLSAASGVSEATCWTTDDNLMIDARSDLASLSVATSRPCAGWTTASRTRRRRWLERFLKVDRQPGLSAVLFYAIWNIASRMQLHVLGWDYVWQIRKRVVDISLCRLADETSEAIADWLLEAARRAQLVPGVSSGCTAHALASFKMLSLLGYAPSLHIGVTVIPFEAHMWVSVGNSRVDLAPVVHSLLELRLR